MVSYNLSNLVFGIGRFVVITTADQVDGKNIIAETYVFGLDIESIFKGTLVEYQYSDGDENITDIGLNFMQQEAMNQAKIIISEILIEKYNQTKDINFIKLRDIEFQECRKEILVTLKNRWYREDLVQLANDTQSSELKDYLRAILSLKVTVRTYEKPAR